MIDKSEFNLILSPFNGEHTMSMIISLLHKLKQNKKCLIIGYESEILDKIKFLTNSEKISTEIKNNLFIIDINNIYKNKINIYELEKFINDEKIDFLFIDLLSEIFNIYSFIEKKSIKKEIIIEKKVNYNNHLKIDVKSNITDKLFQLCYKKNIGILVNLPCSNNQHINNNINFSLFLYSFSKIFQITSKESHIIGIRNFVSFRLKTMKDRESKYPKQFNINNHML